MSRVKEIKKELKDSKDINVFVGSNGAKIIEKNLRKDLLNSIDRLAYGYNELSHAEIMGHCATLRANLALIRTFRNAPAKAKILKEEFELALKEEGETELS